MRLFCRILEKYLLLWYYMYIKIAYLKRGGFIMSKFKPKHTIIDKIVFSLTSIVSLTFFVLDIVKDLIPDEQWELKILIAIVGTLSGFFSIMSFYWDKKISNMTNQISVAYDNNFEKLSASIDIFEKEDFHSYNSFNDAIMPIFLNTNEFDEIKIFAYSAKNYIECLMRSNVRVKKLSLCLKRADDYSAWCVRNNKNAEKYKKELELVMDNLESLKERQKILNYEVRFYDFESYSHFGIFNNILLFGDLIPLFSDKKTVKIGEIHTLSNIGRNKSFYESKEEFFRNLFSCSGTDSGLKITKEKCHYCETSELIQDPHHINGTLIDYGKCDISLFDNTNIINDFILEPDFHPISELHMLLVSKFHILNLFDYLYHKDAVKNLQHLVYNIRNVIYQKTGQEIILFEHGTSAEGSGLTASSIEHLHMHIIYEPKSYNYINAIAEDNKKTPLFDVNRGMIQLKTIEDFANENLIKNKDYFMIWKPGKSIAESRIYVWFPNKKSSQYLRRIFFQGLSVEEKTSLYSNMSGDSLYDDEYDWKKYNFNYSDNRLCFHKDIGKAIENECKRTWETC